MQAVRQGKVAFELAHGMDVYQVGGAVRSWGGQLLHSLRLERGASFCATHA